jgi:hypothetical protein
VSGDHPVTGHIPAANKSRSCESLSDDEQAGLPVVIRYVVGAVNLNHHTEYTMCNIIERNLAYATIFIAGRYDNEFTMAGIY